MVLAWQPRRPMRAFTHLTYTGEDRHSAPVCCDLSRVARIHPAWPLPKRVLETDQRKTSASDIQGNLENAVNEFKVDQAIMMWLNQSGCVNDSLVCSQHGEAAANDHDDENVRHLRKRPKAQKFLANPSLKRFKTGS